MTDADPKPTPDAMTSVDPPRAETWGRVRSSLDDAAITRRLEALAKRGELAGYAKVQGGWEFAAFGAMIDVRMRMVREGEGVLACRARLERKPIWVLVATTAIAVWPGSWLTDSMLRSYFSSYDWNTYAWYIPLTILPVPWALWKVVRSSRRAAWAHFQEVLPRVVAAVDGTSV